VCCAASWLFYSRSFAFISVPPPALLIAGQSRRVTATNTLTRYGFLQSRLESQREVRSAAGAQRGDPRNNSQLDDPVHDPQIILNSADFAAQLSKCPPPVPGRVSAGLRRLKLISRKGQSKLVERDPPPPPPPPNPQHGCPVTPVMSSSATEPIVRLIDSPSFNKCNYKVRCAHASWPWRAHLDFVSTFSCKQMQFIFLNNVFFKLHYVFKVLRKRSLRIKPDRYSLLLVN